MVKAPPDNLGSRQRALNARVNEAAENNADFESIRKEPEITEVDKLYKIDLAAKYKNIDYILEVLKSGDSLYTTRALKKCKWLYIDEYSHILNPTYLTHNVFPFTSLKMKRKILKAAAANVTNPNRAVVFYDYCMQEKMKNSAFTALLYTADEFKLDQLRNNKDPAFKTLQNKDMIYFRFLVGKSFELLDALLSFIDINWKIPQIARQFKNFFSESEENYLDIAEKYVSTYFGFQTDKFDLKLSDSIMKRHKHRVLTKSKFYVNTVDTDVLVRNSTIEDAKIYAEALLPQTAYRFWALRHYTIYYSVFRIIPHDKTYEFFKTYFAEHYPGAEFEMDPGFYEQEYYKFMTNEQREEWAYKQLKNEQQILGVGKDYVWYRFISFDKAFEEIKRYISITKNADTRNEMIEVLIESAKNDSDLEILFIYYHKRHMNELRKYRERFLNKVLSHYNVFEFYEACWTAFYTLLKSMTVDSATGRLKIKRESEKSKDNYNTVALLYHILHKKELPQELTAYLLDHFRVQSVQDHLDRISDEHEQQILHEFFFNFYMNIIAESKSQAVGLKHFRSEVEPKWKRYFDNMDTSMRLFNEDGEEPHVYQPEGKKKRRYRCSDHIGARSLLRDLKKDKQLLISNLPRVQDEFESFVRKIDVFLNKLRVYFPDDITNTYIEMFRIIMANDKLVNGNVHRRMKHVKNAVATSVNAIFHLADEETKQEFMKQYYPVTQSADRKKLSAQHLRIQKAICRFACKSRPPVPLSSIAVFMRGYTAKSCLQIFNTYVAILPLPMCKQFVQLIIDAPVSIQKHAIRLAFQCFNFDDLKEIILNIWKTSKNVTLRDLIYKAFFNKVLDTKRDDYYGILKVITLELNQDDEAAVFDITVSRKTKLPEQFLANYIEAVWEAVDKFKDVEPNVTRKKNVIIYMRNHLRLMREEFVVNVVQNHVNEMMVEEKLQEVYSEKDIADLYKQKWLLTEHCIMHYVSNNPPEKYVELAQFIVRKTIESWDKVAYEKHVYQKCFEVFLNNLKNISYEEEYGKFEKSIPVFEAILVIIDTDLQYYQSYLIKWELELLIISAHVIKKYRIPFKEFDEKQIFAAMTEFVEEMGKLVSSYVANKRYFISLLTEIKALITNNVQQFLMLVYKDMDEKEFNTDDCLILLAANLTGLELKETSILAIQLMPSDYQKYSGETFKCLVNKLKSFQNEEVQLLLYRKIKN